MRQAHHSDEPPRLIDLIAAAGYLIGMVGVILLFIAAWAFLSAVAA